MLQTIADNPALFEELKNVLLKHFELNDIQAAEGFSNELLGQMLRARLHGITQLKKAFAEIASHSSSKTISQTNPAR